VLPTVENINICSNHEDCEARPGQIKLTKGFSAKEPVKGHMASSFFHNLNHIHSIESME
jgi:alkylated DNA repair protein alkB family protein 5